MGASYVGAGVVASNGSASTTTVSISPAFHANAISGDRLFAFSVSSVNVNTITAGWTNVISNLSLGSGALSSGTGARLFNLWYRDYDGVFGAPSITTVSAVAPTITGATGCYRKAPTDTWDPISTTSGSDTTSHTAMSVVMTSLSFKTGGFVQIVEGWPATPTTGTAPGLTASGVTFTGLAATNAVNGSSTGNMAFIEAHNASMSVGATATPTFTLTLGTARTSGALLFQVSATPLNTPINRARYRAANW